MAQQNIYDKYQSQSIMTATPEELTLMLYNGCLKFISLAELAMKENKKDARNNNLQKSQAIILELSITLNMDVPISENLKQLYSFVNEKLIEANINNNQKSLDEAKLIITDMRDTWKEAMKLARMK